MFYCLKHTEELQQQIEMIELLLSAEQAKVKASEEDIKEFTTTIEVDKCMCYCSLKRVGT